MRAALAVIRKEFIHIRRERRLVAFIVVLPLAFMLLFGYALRLQIDNVNLAVLDEDRSMLSLLLKDQLDLEGAFVMSEVDSVEVLRRRILTGEARVGLHIPSDFSSLLFEGKQATVRLYVDGTMPAVAVGVENDASVITERELASQLLFSPPDEPPPVLADPPIDLEKIFLFNPDLRDVYFFIPGIIGVLIMQVGLILTSTAIVREKENRTLEQLIVTPIRRWELVMGKIFPYAVISLIDFYLVRYLGEIVFGLNIVGSWFLLLVLAIVYIAALLGLGTLISTFSETREQAMFISVFVLVPSILLSGFIFPVEAIPPAVRWVSWLLPLTYFMEIVRGIMLKGSGIDVLWMDYAALVMFAAIFITIDVLRFRKRFE